MVPRHPARGTRAPLRQPRIAVILATIDALRAEVEALATTEPTPAARRERVTVAPEDAPPDDLARARANALLRRAGVK